MEIKKMASMKFFVTNLNNFISYSHLESVKDLSDYLLINYTQLISWLNFHRVPPLNKIDAISDSMFIYSKDLIGSLINYQEYSFNYNVNNSSPEKFCINLRKYLNKYDIKTAKDFVAYFDGSFSHHTYYSYFKKNKSKTPSIRTIEIMSSYFDIEPYKLIE